ncbi:general stress protein [Rhizohabitans arisaemae]|uniref:general stress protein n=1 Tax=Rhizohabitans arisaemae TaxID=2720610 RepID=UPI0024B27417|nr:general stress protein [Rhizohabitans arisaemae]
MTSPLAPKFAAIPADAQTIASYASYAEAQRSVDYLSDNRFPVENLAIVGADLRSIERVTGRLNWAKSALYGALTGVWIGLFVGLLLALFTPGIGAWLRIVVYCAIWGAIFGVVFGLIRYAFTGGQRDFTSVQTILAGRYDVLCAAPLVPQARQMLEHVSAATAQVPQQPAAPSVPQHPSTAGAPQTPPAARSDYQPPQPPQSPRPDQGRDL